MTSNATLRRYTSVLSLLDMLHHKRLTLLNPARWFDQNDALGLRQYGKIHDNMVFAACFAEGPEQAHHWQIFAGDSHGVAIVFNKQCLTAILDEINGIYDLRHGPVIYCNLKELSEKTPIPVDQLPFLKRETFKAEQEYRIVALDHAMFGTELMHIPIHIGCIERVIFGPAMPDPLAQSLKDIAAEFDDCSKISFTKSRLVNNQSWADALAKALGDRSQAKA